MTREEVINLYNIELESRILGSNDDRYVSKTISVNNSTIDRYLYDWKNVNDIDEDLLAEFDIFNQDPDAYFETVSSGEFADVTSTLTRFYEVGNHDFPDGYTFELPTEHFKIIIEIWRDFLLEPPLDRTKLDGNGNIV